MSENSEENTSNIEEVSIKDEMKNCYLDYSMSVIVGRALPDVRDGLKPVHRRALYAMYALGNSHNKPFLKSARVVGDVIGKYHPHGDSAVYNTIVRMAQDFSMRYPLIEGQGNFGSIDGDSAAAMRYTEIRMEKFSEELLRDLDKETVDWRPNYDDSLNEPQVLPTKIPNLLVNGSSGIAVGMATNIPPHNLKEVMQALKATLNNRDITLDELMTIIPGPDFPTAGSIYGIQGIRSAYKYGRGIIQVKAKANIEPLSKDRERIVVTELPYQINKARLIEKIADLVNAKHIKGIADIRDESNKEGIRICIDLKRGEMGSVILNQLYKQSGLQSSFGINFLSIFNGGPKLMNLKEQLVSFIDHRREVVIRRTTYLLKKAKERAHILEGLKISVENIDAVVEHIKKSKGPSEAREKLQQEYSFSVKQAQAVLDMKLQRLTGLERDKIVADYNKVMAEIERLEGILGSEELIKGVIGEEFDEIIENYGDERKTEIVVNADEIQMEDLIKKEDVLVTITSKGYIKRMSMDTYKIQKRGGMGVKGGTASDDVYTDIFSADTHSTLLFFTSKGNVFAKKVYAIPEGARVSKGRNIANFLQIPPEESITRVICRNDLDSFEGKYLFFATKKGFVKKTFLSEYKRISNAGLRAIKIESGDSLVGVKVTDGTKDILLCSSKGKIIRFSEESCRSMGRVSRGVKGISLGTGEKVIGMEMIEDEVELLTITDRGYGKRTLTSLYRGQARGGKGVYGITLSEKRGNIKAIKLVTKEDGLIVISDKGQVIRVKVSNIPLYGKVSQGVRVVKLKAGEKVVAVEKVIEATDPEETSEED